jgi:hypothetical protein
MKLIKPYWLTFAAIGALLQSSPSLARWNSPTFEEANLTNYANRIGLAQPAAMPPKGKYDVNLQVLPGADGKVLNGGRLCAGFAPPKTIISPFAERIGSAWDVDSNLDAIAPNAPRLTIRIHNSSTIQRCVMISEYSSTCYITTRISGEIEQRISPQQLTITPLQSDVTREIREGIVCPAVFKYPDKNQREYAKWAAKNGGESAAVALVNREAVVSFFDAAIQKVQPVETAGR